MLVQHLHHYSCEKLLLSVQASNSAVLLLPALTFLLGIQYSSPLHKPCEYAIGITHQHVPHDPPKFCGPMKCLPPVAAVLSCPRAFQLLSCLITIPQTPFLTCSTHWVPELQFDSSPSVQVLDLRYSTPSLQSPPPKVRNFGCQWGSGCHQNSPQDFPPLRQEGHAFDNRSWQLCSVLRHGGNGVVLPLLSGEPPSP